MTREGVMPMKKALAAVLVTLILVAVCGVSLFAVVGGSYTADFLKSLAERAEASGRDTIAVHFYRESLKYNPYSTDARLALVRMCIEQGELAQARELLKAGTAQSPNNLTFYTELSRVYVLEGRLFEAIELLDNLPDGYAAVRVSRMRPQVSLSPRGGVFEAPFYVRIETTEDCYFTLDGTTPQLSSQRYERPLELSPGTYTLSVVSLDESGLPSRVVTERYTVEKAQSASLILGVCPYCGQYITGPLPTGEKGVRNPETP
ncbi:MAG: tetratricopeptide repeat protein [Clostridia bacterium]|nr:tetratricopeptide repeat protein [Clostridia bacterium]